MLCIEYSQIQQQQQQEHLFQKKKLYKTNFTKFIILLNT
jgi:hypothetical protein